MNQTIKKVLNWAIKHLTKVTCKQNDNLRGFPEFPVSTSSDQDILKTKSSNQATFLILIAVADGFTGLVVATTPCICLGPSTTPRIEETFKLFISMEKFSYKDEQTIHTSVKCCNLNGVAARTSSAYGCNQTLLQRAPPSNQEKRARKRVGNARLHE